eukprot:2370-Heterococcus_DN1.PRE.3
MPPITLELIRRKSEHNEGLIHTLEEISLHQEEIEKISDVLGSNCRRLKILYLQNNIIGRMENLHHMKELEYLNLALNNITKIEGLGSCEFLNKLDLTVNFINLDHLETSIAHLASRTQLKDLYMIGNPAQSDWPGFSSYVIACLPQLERLDGKEITRSMRITAQQQLPQLQEQLQKLAVQVSEQKVVEAQENADKLAESKRQVCYFARVHASDDKQCYDIDEDAIQDDDTDVGVMTKSEYAAKQLTQQAAEQNENTKHTPDVRTKMYVITYCYCCCSAPTVPMLMFVDLHTYSLCTMQMYRELAEQKREKDERAKSNMPRDRDYEQEHADSIDKARQRESDGVIRQCNEGKLDFSFDESTKPGCVSLDVNVPRHLDSSLIDVDVHPHYISIVIKGKVLRLTLPVEVKAGEAKAQRSKTTGHLVVIMPKANSKETIGLFKPTATAAAKPLNAAQKSTARSKVNSDDTALLSIAAMMLRDAAAATNNNNNNTLLNSTSSTSSTSSKAVSVHGIVQQKRSSDENSSETTAQSESFLSSTTSKRALITEHIHTVRHKQSNEAVIIEDTRQHANIQQN